MSCAICDAGLDKGWVHCEICGGCYNGAYNEVCPCESDSDEGD